jgi:hypothetical protein
MAVGVGISINNSRAVVAGLVGHRATEFRRTPKYALAADRAATLATRKYRARRGIDTWLEIALGVYFLALVIAALAGGLFGAVPFLSLFAGGFLCTGWLGLRDSSPFGADAVLDRPEAVP